MLTSPDTATLEAPLPTPAQLRNQRGQFSQEEQAAPIHILEYRAVLNALTALKPQIRDTCVRLWCDNQVVCSGLLKEYSAKQDIHTLIKQIFNLLREANASIIPQWISTHKNVAADELSRTNVGDNF